MLANYGIKPEHFRDGLKTVRGYRRSAFVDAWARYCAPTPQLSGTTGTRGTGNVLNYLDVPDKSGVPDTSGTEELPGTRNLLETNDVPDVPVVPAPEGVAPITSSNGAVSVLSWDVPQKSIEIEGVGLVTDAAKFANTRIEELKLAIANPNRRVGWSTSQLVSTASRRLASSLGSANERGPRRYDCRIRRRAASEVCGRAGPRSVSVRASRGQDF